MAKNTHYNGNVLLKKTHKPIQWTLELGEEYEKCRLDPIYFAQKYIKIVTLDHGLVPISLYDFQRDIIQKIDKERSVIVTTSRQAGKM